MWRFALVSVVCCLTLAASGDDIDLLRLVTPSLLTTLPLDDPNSDFQASADSGVGRLAPNPFQLAAPSPVAPMPALSAAPSPPHPASVSNAHTLCLPVATPIRC